MQRTLTTAIFDLDGTLLDSMGVWAAVDEAFLLRRGIEMPDDYSAMLAPMGFPAAAAYTRARFSLPESEEAIMTEWHEMAVDAYTHHIEAKPFVREYLSMLRQKHISIAAATASQAVFYRPALQRCGLFSYFSSITEISEVSRGKGFPDIYLRAAEKMNRPPEQCAVFEDICAGISGARAGGFFCVGVYDAHTMEQDILRRSADRYIYDFSELLQQDIFEDGFVSGS